MSCYKWYESEIISQPIDYRGINTQSVTSSVALATQLLANKHKNNNTIDQVDWEDDKKYEIVCLFFLQLLKNRYPIDVVFNDRKVAIDEYVAQSPNLRSSRIKTASLISPSTVYWEIHRMISKCNIIVPSNINDQQTEGQAQALNSTLILTISVIWQ